MKAKYILLPLLLGVLAALADGCIFSNAWAALDWRSPIAEWLADRGLAAVAGWFGLVWIRVPTFIVAGCLGILIARLFMEQWIAAVCSGSVGFVGVSFVLSAWHVSPVFGWGGVIKTQAWSAVSISLLLLGAWLYVRWRDRNNFGPAQ